MYDMYTNHILRNPHEDTDPLITYRGHTLGVTKVEISTEQGRLYSSSLDSTIRIWKIPPSDRTPYAPVGKIFNFCHQSLSGHVITLNSFNI